MFITNLYVTLTTTATREELAREAAKAAASAHLVNGDVVNGHLQKRRSSVEATLVEASAVARKPRTFVNVALVWLQVRTVVQSCDYAHFVLCLIPYVVQCRVTRPFRN
jgi:hypothetical protein